MFRCLIAVSFTLALAVLSLFGAGCSSSSPANVRFVHAIQDGAAMDISISGKTEFTGVSFLNVQPNQPGYTSIPSGNNTIEGLLAGTSTIGFNSTTVSWTSGTDYTVIATGHVTCTPPCTPNATIVSIPDNNSPPPTNDVEFRFIHASPSGPPGGSPTVDIYVQLIPSAGPTGTPAVSGLAYTQASGYFQTVYNPNSVDQFLGYQIFVTPAGSTSPVFINEAIDPANGAIKTLILTDFQNGTAMSSSFLELPDLH
jgi:Domain of unknown function (DUF4397)